MEKYKLAAQKYRVIWFSVVVVILAWGALFAIAAAAPQLQGEDLALIASPTSSAAVSGVVPIMGSADYPTFQFYIIEFHPEPVTGDRWQIIGQMHETPVVDGQLETWDTTGVPDGTYSLRLRVVRLDGNYSEAFAEQIAVSNSQPVPTDTPTPGLDEPLIPAVPTVTPTDLPPTPTIVIDQPIVATATPRPTETPVALVDPAGQGSSLIPTVSGFALSPLQDACLFGAGVMLIVFLLFGFLAALRTLIIGFIQQGQRRSR